MEAENDLSSHVEGAEAIVFAAGAGSGSGVARKKTVDLGAAVKLIEAAQATGVNRQVAAAPELERGGQIPRDDVAAVLLAVLRAPSIVGKAFDVVGGDTPIEDALRAV